MVPVSRLPDWKDLYFLQFATVILFLGFVPIGTLVMKKWGYITVFPFASIYGGVLLFVQDRAINWKCPRCSKPFLRKNGNGIALPYRSHCGSCGLRNGHPLYR